MGVDNDIIMLERGRRLLSRKACGSSGLPINAILLCADSSGAKLLSIISMLGVGSRLNRLPSSAPGLVSVVSVKAGSTELRRRILLSVVIRQRRSFRRREGLFLFFEDNASVIVTRRGEVKSLSVSGPICHECAELVS